MPLLQAHDSLTDLTHSNNNKNKIAVRPAEWTDFAKAARVFSKAFDNDAVVGDIIHPFRQQHPLDVDFYWLQELRLAMVKPLSQVDVAYEQGSPDRIIGVSLWLRKAPVASYDPQTIQDIKTIEAYNELENRHANKAVDPAEYDVFQRAGPFTKHYWSGSRATSHYLSFLGVDPDSQGQGVGAALLKVGVDRAKELGLGASVIAQAGTADFYVGQGFEIAGSANPGTPDYPLAGAPAATVLFMDSP